MVIRHIKKSWFFCQQRRGNWVVCSDKVAFYLVFIAHLASRHWLPWVRLSLVHAYFDLFIWLDIFVLSVKTSLNIDSTCDGFMMAAVAVLYRRKNVDEMCWKWALICYTLFAFLDITFHMDNKCYSTRLHKVYYYSDVSSWHDIEVKTQSISSSVTFCYKRLLWCLLATL